MFPVMSSNVQEQTLTRGSLGQLCRHARRHHHDASGCTLSNLTSLSLVHIMILYKKDKWALS
jgi:hypothetical protein